MLIYGHRGAAGLLPENTLGSIGHAINLGVDGIEFDIRCSRDHVPVVIHDVTIDRTVGRPGRVDDLTAAELQAFSIEGRERIPTLAEVLWTGRGVLQNLELKEFRACAATYDALSREFATGMLDRNRILVSSFDWNAIATMREFDSSLPLALLIKGSPPAEMWSIADSLAASSINTDLGSVDATLVAKAKTRGLRVMVYTVNKPEDGIRMRELGVDAIFTDFPDRFIGTRARQ